MSEPYEKQGGLKIREGVPLVRRININDKKLIQ